MKYESLRWSLKTGDILQMRGKGLFSWILGRFGWASHVGMVLVVEGMVFVYESTTLSTVRDYFTGKKVKGVQVVLLSERLRTYKGKIRVRQLEKPLTSYQKEILEECRQEFRDRKYEQSLWQLIRAGFKWRIQAKDLSSIFCSELTAEVQQRQGIMRERYPSNEINPWDYDPGGVAEKEIEIMGHRLLPPILLEV